jgi:hypothetical protein
LINVIFIILSSTAIGNPSSSSEEVGNEIIDLELLSLALRSFVKCSECNGGDCISVETVTRTGWASELNLQCDKLPAVFASDPPRRKSEFPFTR